MADNSAVEMKQAEPWQDGGYMRRWLRDEKIITGNLLLPTIEACQDLADFVGGMHMIVEGRRGSWGAYEARRKRCSEAIRVLLDDLPGWVSELQTSVEPHPAYEGFVARKMAQDLAALRSLHQAAEVARGRQTLFALSMVMLSEKFDQWHDFARGLREAFRSAVRSTNPVELRVSNNGPIVRFLVAAIPHITGETPTPAAVARYLQRMQG